MAAALQSLAPTQIKHTWSELSLTPLLYMLINFFVANLQIFFVEKKDRGLWHCIDYQAFKEMTILYRHPLSHVPPTHYEYYIMLYGMVNAPFIFQGLITEVIWEYLQHVMLVYINNILVYFWSMVEHHHPHFSGPQ